MCRTLKAWTESIEAGPHQPKLFSQIMSRDDETIFTVKDFSGPVPHLNPDYQDMTLDSMWAMASGVDRALVMHDDWILTPSPILKCHNGCGRMLPKHLRPFWHERVFDTKCICEHCAKLQGQLKNPTEGAMIQDRTAYSWDVAAVQIPFDLWNMIRGKWASDDFYGRSEVIWTDPCNGLTCATSQTDRVNMMQAETQLRVYIQQGDKQELGTVWNRCIDTKGNCTVPAWRNQLFEPLFWKSHGWASCPHIVNLESTWKDALPLDAFKAYTELSLTVYPCSR